MGALDGLGGLVEAALHFLGNLGVRANDVVLDAALRGNGRGLGVRDLARGLGEIRDARDGAADDQERSRGDESQDADRGRQRPEAHGDLLAHVPMRNERDRPLCLTVVQNLFTQSFHAASPERWRVAPHPTETE